jgi:putative addiction module component (TIGR02574 family)
MPLTREEIDRLTDEEKIDLIETAWASWSESAKAFKPGWHKQVLEERLAEYRANSDAGSTWEEVKARLRARRSS